MNTTSSTKFDNPQLLRLLGMILFLIVLFCASLKLAPVYFSFIVAGVVASVIQMCCGAYLTKRNGNPKWSGFSLCLVVWGLQMASHLCMPERVFYAYWFYYLAQWVTIWVFILIPMALILSRRNFTSS